MKSYSTILTKKNIIKKIHTQDTNGTSPTSK